MNIFISYPRQEASVAERLAKQLSDRKRAHNVFLDVASLPAGDEYDQTIKSEIERADLFIFLISPGSVSAGRYTLTELCLAQRKWPHPELCVLPVEVRDTPFELIPDYLKLVTILRPRGNVAADVAIAVDRLVAARRRVNSTAGLVAGFVSGLLTVTLMVLPGPTAQATPQWVKIPMYSMVDATWRGIPFYPAVPFAVSMSILVFWVSGKRLWDTFVMLLGVPVAAFAAMYASLSFGPYTHLLEGLPISAFWTHKELPQAFMASAIPGFIGASGVWLAVALSNSNARNLGAWGVTAAIGSFVGSFIMIVPLLVAHAIGEVGNMASFPVVAMWQTLVGFSIGRAVAVR